METVEFVTRKELKRAADYASYRYEVKCDTNFKRIYDGFCLATAEFIDGQWVIDALLSIEGYEDRLQKHIETLMSYNK